jgi:hypothetical protein
VVGVTGGLGDRETGKSVDREAGESGGRWVSGRW